ncbi:NAC domain-containing protein 37-like [Silene latifolia]|uniref:NAC domain-containing protein 37-like n=1 Tax=Silene latifolia TaxID=37657 RepID=UPI003D7797A0
MAGFNLPVGYKFEPTKELLVGYFLNKRLSNQPLDPCYNDVIMDFDVYSNHPAKIMTLTKRKVEEDGFQQGYFFSPLTKYSKTNKNGKNINRLIPSHGTWSEKAGTKTIRYQNEVIGIHKYYKFNPDSKSKGNVLNKDAWMMHEYSVSDNQDWVLCHITNKKKSHNKSTNKTRKINMVVDQPLDNEAGPSKRSRVDPHTYTACIDDILLNMISAKGGDKCADHGGGVKND